MLNWIKKRGFYESVMHSVKKKKERNLHNIVCDASDSLYYLVLWIIKKAFAVFLFADVRGKYAGGREWSLGQTCTLETAQRFISLPTVALLLLKWLLI